MATQEFTPFLTIRHPVEGAISFSVDGEGVKIRCHWPFDLDLVPPRLAQTA
jgi:hypothetical protein